MNMTGWTDSKILSLIEEYKKRPCLWDPSDEYNKVSSKKNQAWQEISCVLHYDVNEIKRKVASLLASFRRERKRGQSHWYAFNQLSFLLDKFKGRSAEEGEEDNSTEWWNEHDELTDEPELLPVSAIDDKSEIQIDTKNCFTTQYIQANPLSDADDHISQLSHYTGHSLPPRKKHKPDKSIETPSNESYSNNQHRELIAPKKKSVSELFIAYLSAKLDTYTEYERNIVQHKINDILFQADIGKFAKETKENENS